MLTQYTKNRKREEVRPGDPCDAAAMLQTNENTPLARFTRCEPGFALISCLMLLLLIVVVAVGLLQLATISLRSVDQESMQAQARANARLSLMLAIGQLQQELGPDKRISAPGGVLDSDPATQEFDGVAQPHWTGVWEATESPFIRWTLDRPSYDKKAGFRRWLVSGNPDDAGLLDTGVKGPVAGGQVCEAVAKGGAAGSSRGVSVPVVAGPRSGFAWWTSDDGVKAVMRPGEKPDATSKSATLLALRRSDANGHSVIDPKLPDRENGLDQRLVNLATVDAAVTSAAGEERAAWRYIHDLTTHSETVPVDVTTGSLRKCMNLWLDWLGGQSPAARAAAGTAGKLRSASMDARLFSWDQLRNYESLARAGSMLTVDPVTKRPKIRTHKQNGMTGSKGDSEWNPEIGADRFRIQPVLLKLSYVVSYATERLTAPADPSKPYALRLYLYPMVVLWNPYNVDLEVPEYCAHGFCPLIFEINKGRPGSVKVDLTQNQSATLLGFGPEMGGSQKLTNLLIPAGATKVLYPQPVRWESHETEHRHNRFRWHYYMWAQAREFDLGPGNYGGVLKNLRGNQEVASFSSIPNSEIAGAAMDPVSISVTPSGAGPVYSFGVNGAHTDWWGNNGPGADSAETLQRFGATTSVSFKIEGNTPQISLIKDSEVPTRTFAQLEGRPTPLLLFEFYRKAADEDLFPSKTNSFSMAGNPIHARTDSSLGTKDSVTPWFESAYSFRFNAINSWIDVTKTFQMPPDRDDRVFFGSSYSPHGQLNVVDQEIPLTPLVSLAELQHLPLFDYRPTFDPGLKTFNTPQWYSGDYWFHEGRVTQFPQNHAIGNSYASPGIPADRIVSRGWRCQFNAEADHQRVDRSYIANSVLWDSWFCSSLGNQDGAMLLQDGTKRTARQVAAGWLDGSAVPPNDAMVARSGRPVPEVLGSLFDATGNPSRDAYQKIAAHLRIAGGFNVNSVSVEAWTHFLCGLLSRPHLVMASRTGGESPAVIMPEAGSFLIARHSLGNAPPAERAAGREREDRYWNGSREVSAAQVRELATAIVIQVKKRGPFLSLAEFVNRRVSRDTELALSGALQSALDDPAVSINEPFRSDIITGSERSSAGAPIYPFPEAAKGPRRQGITGYVTQADLLQSVGDRLTPRSDTFTIRAMGEARDANGVVRSRVWCEATVQRGAAYVDPGDDAATSAPSLKQSANLRFGRRFEVVSFRWLNPQEVQP
jgi:hypothetical protein